MADTQLIPSIQPHCADANIVRAIDTASSGIRGVHRWRFGIRNEAGLIYRRGTVDCLVSTIQLAHAMGRLAFEDEMLAGQPVEGFDSVFRPRD
jgi:hypothetical protein